MQNMEIMKIQKKMKQNRNWNTSEPTNLVNSNVRLKLRPSDTYLSRRLTFRVADFYTINSTFILYICYCARVYTHISGMHWQLLLLFL